MKKILFILILFIQSWFLFGNTATPTYTNTPTYTASPTITPTHGVAPTKTPYILQGMLENKRRTI